MEKKIFKPFNIEIKSTDEEKRTVVAIGSQQKVDRDGDVVKVDGIDFKNYKKNPVVLWAHRHDDLPIGKAERVWKEDGKLMFKIKYAEPEVYSFADTVYKLTKGGYINAFSIGFAPDMQEAEFNEKNGGYDFNKSELLEISAVPVPANPMALVQSKSIQKAVEDKVIDDLELTEMKILLEDLIIDDDEIEKSVNNLIDEIDEELSDEDIDKNREQTTEKTDTITVDKDSDSDPYDWIFKDLETDESKANPQDDLLDELLNYIKDED